MTLTEQFLDALIANLGEWTCSLCNTGSNQPASTFRELKKLGYQFEEVGHGRWAQTMWCDHCGTNRSHYKLLSSEPVFTAKPRLAMSTSVRTRVLTILGMRDAFTGASITSTPEIDHKVPWARLDQDVDTSSLDDSQLREHFQLLTREHNLLKDRSCTSCIQTGRRPAFLGIPYWYEGTAQYHGSCVGCGWHDGAAWRAAVAHVFGGDT